MSAADADRLAAARVRLAAMVADRFGGQVLRDLVPNGRKISVALADEALGDAVRRAVAQSGLPAFLAVDEAGREALTILVIREVVPRRGNQVTVRIYRPGDWTSPNRPLMQNETLATFLAAVRSAHGET